jgi:hypothetical protein
VTGRRPGWLGVTPVSTTAFFAPQLGQRQNGVPSCEWFSSSIVTSDRHFLQMNCCAVGTLKCYP